METLKLEISGMSCSHCVNAVTSALRELNGVQVEQVAIGTASVSHDPVVAPRAKIVQAIEDAGYDVGPTQLKRA